MTDEQIIQINIGVLCGLVWGSVLISGVFYLISGCSEID